MRNHRKYEVFQLEQPEGDDPEATYMADIMVTDETGVMGYPDLDDATFWDLKTEDLWERLAQGHLADRMQARFDAAYYGALPSEIWS